MPPVACARVLVHFRDGTALWLRYRETATAKYTPHKRWSLVLTREAAEEMVSRLHQVQALGQCWREVSFFDVVPVKPRNRRTR